MKIETKIRDPKVLKKCDYVLDKVKKGLIRPKKLNNGLGKTLAVGFSHRIVIGKNKALLMTHEQYNKFIDNAKNFN